ncbi:COX assembly mitochondrial protein 1 [Grifola frondosa]|uniref:COX assembly mitochondrial protein n=1 Tax=Grifola frondosa TaxID=5627 RepID=A0A1C7MHA4_GRIFR|nr:COX assembly mitochondrial protein 1 [Grifola frondosa]
MHPQLSDKKLVCMEFIQALEACHADPWSKWTGGCNGVKTDLNMCLRKERVGRSDKNRESAKLRREKTAQVWKEIRDEA